MGRTLLNDLLSFALSLLTVLDKSARRSLIEATLQSSVNLHPEGSGFLQSFGLTVYIMRLAFELNTMQ